MSDSNRIIHLVGSWAPLFSGNRLSDCKDANDETCVGGVAATAAFARHLAGSPRLIMHRLDKQSQFVQTHPLGWSVNRFILHEYYGYNFFSSSPSILLQHKDDFVVSQRDISDLQTHDMPLILTNAAVPPSVFWFPYVERVHYDANTNLAILSLAGHGEPLVVEDQVAAARAALADVAKENEEREDCQTFTESLYDAFLAQNLNLFQVDALGANSNISNNNDLFERRKLQTTTDENTFSSNSANNRCWIPVLYYSDSDPENFASLVDALAAVEHPPAMMIDGGGNDVHKLYTDPAKVDTPNCAYTDSMWVASMTYGGSGYYQKTLTLTEDNRRIEQVELTLLHLEEDMLPEYKDESYARDIAFLRQLADQAEANNPVVGESTAMPVARVNNYRRCKGGECEQGNLFADALRWKAKSDVAFITSGGLRGSGWPAGNVSVANIWETLPFPNTSCTGVMAGVSLFKLVDYSMGAATFESQDTEAGGRLLQVSGMKIVYNTLLNEHRVISIDIWDEAAKVYKPIERRKLYTFATDSYLCGGYIPYPSLVGEELVIDGEQAGAIRDDLHQNIVGEYLSLLEAPYNATLQGRLVNNTSAQEPLNLIQTIDGCPPKTYWLKSQASCLNCPNSSHVVFSDERLEFEAESGISDLLPGRILMVNRELESFRVAPKNIPQWLTLTTAQRVEDEDGDSRLQVGGPPALLQPGDSMAVDFAVTAESLEAGTALGTVSFSVLDGGNYPGCTDNSDATFDVLLRVVPPPQYNHLGSIRYVGFSLMGVALLTALSFAIWTTQYRENRVVKKMQPVFLIVICAGVGVISLALGSLSLDDQIVSPGWCNFACMSMPWFVSMGCSVTFAAIYSKLWRINKLFNNAQCRRMKVSERDALVIFGILFALNFIILLIWTLVDPLQWVIKSVTGESWNTYGICASGVPGDAMMGLAIGFNVFAMVLAAFQAYKARTITADFSESKQLGLAIYTWLQVIAVGLPVLFLIEKENVTARYFLQIGLIFCLSITMLLNIFIPLVLHMRRIQKNRPVGGRGTVKVSGLHYPNVRQSGLDTSEGNNIMVIGQGTNSTLPVFTCTVGHDSANVDGIVYTAGNSSGNALSVIEDDSA